MALPMLSQVKPQAYVLIPFDSSVENEVDFKKKLSSFVKTIFNRPDLSGFIAIRGRSYQQTLALRRIAVTVRDTNRRKWSRIGISFPAPGYEPVITETAFWVVPKGADLPFVLRHLNVECPTITVTAPPTVENLNNPLIFTADVTGGDTISYKWSINGGKITQGQGTSSIWVRIKSSMRIDEGMSVTATLKIFGLDPDYNCMDSAAFTTVLASMPKTDN